MDLQRKQNLPSNKLATLMSKFDDMKTSGKMMSTATLGSMEGRMEVTNYLAANPTLELPWAMLRCGCVRVVV